jgi:HPr kinase/phosphorylase
VSDGASAGVAKQGRLVAATTIHATALVLGETGVLIRGPSGSGKSALALALLTLADERKLFARLVGDDRVMIAVRCGRILAEGAPAIHSLIERRGYGIVRERAEACTVIRLVVDLRPEGALSQRMPDADESRVRIGEIALPRLIFDQQSGPFERAYAVHRYLDKIDDKIMTGFAHFT